MAMSAPYDYTYINAANSAASPSTVHCKNTALTWYFRRYLVQKAISVFTWKMPDWWDPDFFRYGLYCCGYLAIVNTNEFGVIPTLCTLGGYNVFYRPRYAVIANPLLKGIMEPIIDEQCTVIRLQPDFGGIMDLVNYYADMLALCAEATGINMVNSKLGFAAGARSKAAAESLKKMYDQLQQGNPLVVYDKQLEDVDRPLFEFFSQDLRQNFISNEILMCMRKIEQEFCTKIGLPNANTDKRERLTDDEVHSNDEETQALAALWLDTVNRECAKAREMFRLPEFSAEWRIKPNVNNVDSGAAVLGS